MLSNGNRLLYVLRDGNQMYSYVYPLLNVLPFMSAPSYSDYHNRICFIFCFLLAAEETCLPIHFSHFSDRLANL